MYKFACTLAFKYRKQATEEQGKIRATLNAYTKDLTAHKKQKKNNFESDASDYQGSATEKKIGH